MKNEKLITCDENETIECFICYEMSLGCCTINKCNHKFHESCLKIWFNKQLSCPMCRCILNHNPFIDKDQKISIDDGDLRNEHMRIAAMNYNVLRILRGMDAIAYGN